MAGFLFLFTFNIQISENKFPSKYMATCGVNQHPLLFIVIIDSFYIRKEIH